MKKIILIGCGNIGARHLQSLAQLAYDLEIHVVEPRYDAFENGRKLFEAARQPKLGHGLIVWHESVCERLTNSDIAIIATTASFRLELIKNLLQMGRHPNLLLEKMVCQTESDYKKLLSILLRYRSKAWVNTIRRYNSTYHWIAQEIKAQRFILDVRGEQFGLGSNAIHYLDLFAMLARSKSLEIHWHHLYTPLLKNKRGNGFVEINGLIYGQDQKGNIFNIASLPFNGRETVVTVISQSKKFIVNETKKSVEVLFGEKKEAVSGKPFQEPLVSQTTSAVLTDIFTRSRCALPTVQDLQSLHVSLLRIFKAHISKATGRRITRVPVT